MPQFRIRFFLRASVVVVFFILIVTIVISAFFNFSKRNILALINTKFSDQLSVGYVGYIFPNSIVVKNIAVHARNPAASKGCIQIPTATAEFSLLRLVFHREVTIQKVKFYNPNIHYGYFSDFISRNGKELMVFLLQLPRVNFRFLVKDALWDFSEQDASSPDYTYLNFVFSLRKETVSVRGSARRDKFGYLPLKKSQREKKVTQGVKDTWGVLGHKRRWQRLAVGVPWEFDFKGFLIDKGIFIDNLDIRRKNLYLKLWGALQNSQLRLNGFSFLDTYPQEEYHAVQTQRNDRLQSYLQKMIKIPARFSFDDKDIYVIDMDFFAQLNLPKVSVERFNFSFNDTPVNITGNFLLDGSFPVDLNILVDPARSKKFALRNVQKIQWHMIGALADKTFISDNDLVVMFDKAKNPNFPFERINASLKDLRFSVDQYGRPDLRVGKGELLLKDFERVRRLSLENLKISLNVLNRKLRMMEIESPFYGGKLAGRIWSTVGPSSSKIDGTISLNDVDVSRLGELLFDFVQAQGRLFGRVHLTSVPRFNFDGQFDIYNGEIEKFAFFQWLADTFNLSSLQKVDFKQASSGFSADVNSLRFQDISLKSDDVNINGYFNIDRNNLVSSYLSLAFSKILLGESPKFRPILRIFGDDIPAIIFNFQLSGKQDAMNFQWLASEHKSMIQQRIPDFIERIIERNIDEMIAPAQEENPSP